MQQIFIAAIICLFPVLCPCQAETPHYKIGWIGSLSGPMVKFGAGQAAQLAVEDINHSGGIHGLPLELIQEDTQGKGQNAVSAFKKLLTVDKVRFILGGHSSPETLPIAPLSRNENVLLIASITSSPKFTGLSPHAIRLTPPSDVAGGLLAQHAYSKAQLRTAAVISEETDYALPAAERFRDVFQAQGGKILQFSTFQSGETDFRALLTKLKLKSPQALYLGVQSQDSASMLVRQTRELGIQVPLYGNEAFGNAPQGTPELAPLFFGSHYAEPEFDPDSSQSAVFVSRFREKYNVPALPFGVWTAEAYDAVRLLAHTINHCGDDPDAVKKCLLETNGYSGVSGMIHFTPQGDGIRTYVLKQILKDGTAKLVH